MIHRRNVEWEAVKKLKSFRVDAEGKREYLVEWEGEDANGNPWPSTWEPEKKRELGGRGGVQDR